VAVAYLVAVGLAVAYPVGAYPVVGLLVAYLGVGLLAVALEVGLAVASLAESLTE